jgi:putative toxin-antitoxin system antitoxin component (TIGR02293 family)
MSQEVFMSAHANVFSFVGVKAVSDLELALLPEKGLPLTAVESLKDQGLTFTEISDIVISPRTLKHRKSRKEKLSSVETDRALRVARIVDLADKVFGSRMKALLWLRSADDRLDNRTPMQMLVNESGGRLVESMLWQIDEGIYT